MPIRAVPYGAMSFGAMTFETMSFRAMYFGAMSFGATSFRAIYVKAVPFGKFLTERVLPDIFELGMTIFIENPTRQIKIPIIYAWAAANVKTQQLHNT